MTVSDGVLLRRHRDAARRQRLDDRTEATYLERVSWLVCGRRECYEATVWIVAEKGVRTAVCASHAADAFAAGRRLTPVDVFLPADVDSPLPREAVVARTRKVVDGWACGAGCGRVFTTKSGAWHHSGDCDGTTEGLRDGLPMCARCLRQFPSAGARSTHEAHCGVPKVKRTYFCDACPATFTAADNLRRHVKHRCPATHPPRQRVKAERPVAVKAPKPEKPERDPVPRVSTPKVAVEIVPIVEHVCDGCDRGFRTASRLERHRRECDDC